MNYLGLTNAFLTESGIADTVNTLNGASDDVLQAAHWINTAWIAFQAERKWPFRWTEGTLPVVNGTTTYTYDDLSLGEGIIIDEDSFWASEGSIDAEDYVDLRQRRRAAASVDTSRVLKVAVRNKNIIETYPDIATSQTLKFDFWAGPTEMTEDEDLPTGLPSAFHMMLVHNGLFRYGADIGGQEGANQYASHGGLYTVLKTSYINSVL